VKIFLPDVTEEGVSFDLSLNFEADSALINVNSFSGMVIEAAGDWFLDGELDVTVNEQCDRCLEKYSQGVSQRVQVSIRKPVETKAEELELSEDDIGVYFVEDEELDLEEVARQEAELLVPLKKLCSEECKGLCAQCGGNLNENECSCKEPGDPRWEVLNKLK